MRFIVQSAVVAATAMALSLPLTAQQQNEPSAPGPQKAATQGKKKDQGRNQGSAAQRNPFPKGKSESAAKKAQEQNEPSAPAPNTGQAGSAAQRNPFPEEKSEQAAKQAQAQEQKSTAAGGNGGSKDYSSSSSGLQDLGGPSASDDAGGTGIASHLDPKLGKKDIQVGEFYLQSGDWKGAYDRFLEATRVDPGSAEAVYGLAASAERLGNRTVAIQNYQLYLSALPNGRKAKACRKALKKMGVTPVK